MHRRHLNTYDDLAYIATSLQGAECEVVLTLHRHWRYGVERAAAALEAELVAIADFYPRQNEPVQLVELLRKDGIFVLQVLPPPPPELATNKLPRLRSSSAD